MAKADRTPKALHSSAQGRERSERTLGFGIKPLPGLGFVLGLLFTTRGARMSKTEIIEMIDRMPDGASLVDIMAALAARHKIEIGLQQADNGETIDHEEARQRFHRWLP